MTKLLRLDLRSLEPTNLKKPGTLFASALVLFCVMSVSPAPAQSIFFNTLLNFSGSNGANPLSPLVQGADGNFYGTTMAGGQFTYGTVFKITPGGALTTLHSFNGADGTVPIGGLAQGSDGNLYGTTSRGGDEEQGTVYKITPDGTLTTLHFFAFPDGYGAQCTLVQASDGNFYGTTPNGGIYGFGTVFKVSPGGVFKTLHDFHPGFTPDGDFPYGGLVLGRDGNFYGTTNGGGDGGGYGTIFKVTPDGAVTTLYSFDGSDGDQPFAGLVRASDGNFYGSASGGGDDLLGTLFKMTPDGNVTRLHSFSGRDGALPIGTLIQGSDGNLYGTTVEGGASNACGGGCGTVFKLRADGTLITLHNFNSSGGAFPYAGVVQGRDGFFYGTTVAGGSSNDGTVYRLGVPHTCATCGP